MTIASAEPSGFESARREATRTASIFINAKRTSGIQQSPANWPERYATHWPIDENLSRPDLTPAQRFSFARRRKQFDRQQRTAQTETNMHCST